MEEKVAVNQELPGMPDKSLATLIAERILDIRIKIADLRGELEFEKRKFVNEMRVKQVSDITVGGFDFHVELEDKVKISKKKKK